MKIPAANTRRLLYIGLLCALVAPASAAASVGTGVGAVPLTLTEPAHAGRSYAFHWLYVKDTGTIASSYRVSARRLAPGSEKVLPASWIHLDPAAFRLAPRGIERVTVTVNIPRSAPSGAYMTDLVAATYAPHRPGATALGAAAADTVAFTIPSTASFPWIALLVTGGSLVLLGLGYAIRRSGLRLQVGA